MSPQNRVIAIGDIHGCAGALALLIDELQLSDQDTVVMLGDAIDRGPGSRAVINQLIALDERVELFCILGNHEQMLLDTLDGNSPAQEWLIHGGAETLDSYLPGGGPDAVDSRHVEFMRGWGDVYETESHFFAHGNYLARKPFDKQPWDELRWESLRWRTPGPHRSGKTAVLGHTSNKQGEIVNLGHLVCIDTYCCGGYWLTAFDATSGRIWQSNENGEFREGELRAIELTQRVE